MLEETVVAQRVVFDAIRIVGMEINNIDSEDGCYYQIVKCCKHMYK